MRIEQVKREVATLSFEEQGELAAYLVQLRNRRDPEYLPEIRRRIENTGPSHWLTPDEFEKRLIAQKATARDDTCRPPSLRISIDRKERRERRDDEA